MFKLTLFLGLEFYLSNNRNVTFQTAVKYRPVLRDMCLQRMLLQGFQIMVVMRGNIFVI